MIRNFEHDACGVGFVVNIKGEKSHEIVRNAITILLNLTHRGAKGAEPTSGDGAGVLLQIPDKFFRKVCPPLGIDLPEPGQYGVGMVFLPRDEARRQVCERKLEEIIEAEGQVCLGWRTVPTDGYALGKTAQSREPSVRQVFIGANPDTFTYHDDLAFERKLYVIRKLADQAIRYSPDSPGMRPVLFRQSFKPDDCLQRHVAVRTGGGLLPRSG